MTGSKTLSMTAYAQGVTNTVFGELSCELRSVNHRFLDIAPRMPEELRVHEGELRELISAKLTRGRIDCFIRLQENENMTVEPNAEMVANLHTLLGTMKQHLPDMQPIRAIDVLRWPGVLQSKQVDPQLMKAELLNVVGEALDELLAARRQEGGKLAALITTRVDEMRAIVEQVKQFLPEISAQYQARLDEKLAEIKDKLDPARLEQELVIFLQKTDVAEELDRLVVHLDEVSAVLTKDAPAGRRLDFLMQELNREVNTLGSKSQDGRLTKASVDLKVLIEQMREQVQNIE